jgi:hypothetical protein
MGFTKRRKKTKRYVRKIQGKMLRFVRRNLKQIGELLERVPGEMVELREKVSAKVEVIRRLYNQQLEMWESNSHRVDDRVVSIHRPQIRPIMVWENWTAD